MKRCTKCIMPETWAGIRFDEEGVCNICRENEKKKSKVDWGKRAEALSKIVREYKEIAKKNGNKYDSMVPYSGGKDSVYALWVAKVKYGMRPLVVTFDHGFKMSSEAEWNLMEIPKILDCDHVRFTLGNGLRNALCRKGSEVNGDFCWHCHNGVGAFPARVSFMWQIPLQVWGEPSGAEYQTEGGYSYEDMEEQNKSHFEKLFQAGITPEKVLPEGYDLNSLEPMMWPEKLEACAPFSLKAIYLGSYEPWNQEENVRIITKELGWKHRQTEGTYVDWDKVDCPFEPVRDWQKFIKRGFGRTTFQASKDVRDGKIIREKALRLAERLDGKKPASMKPFLKETKITEKEFLKLTKKHIVK